MGAPLTTASTVTCADAGTVTLSGQGKLTVSGNKVLASSDVSSWSISGCTQTNANAGQVPCATVVSQSGGKATKLTVGGSPVVLADLSGKTNGTPHNTLSATAGQSKLTAS